jgi:hypothetical protein
VRDTRIGPTIMHVTIEKTVIKHMQTSILYAPIGRDLKLLSLCILETSVE